MTVMRFVDTNILLYAVSTDVRESAKTRIARGLLDATDLVLSVQVLQEFYVQATRPTRAYPLPPEKAAALIESWMRYPVRPVTAPLLMASVGTSTHWSVSYWDATIMEAARAMKCGRVLSEDPQDGMDFGGVRVVNPFF